MQTLLNVSECFDIEPVETRRLDWNNDLGTQPIPGEHLKGDNE